MVTERVVKVSQGGGGGRRRESGLGMKRETARVRDGDMIELQSANETRWKEKRRGETRTRERLQSTSKAAVMKSRV